MFCKTIQIFCKIIQILCNIIKVCCNIIQVCCNIIQVCCNIIQVFCKIIQIFSKIIFEYLAKMVVNRTQLFFKFSNVRPRPNPLRQIRTLKKWRKKIILFGEKKGTHFFLLPLLPEKRSKQKQRLPIIKLPSLGISCHPHRSDILIGYMQAVCKKQDNSRNLCQHPCISRMVCVCGCVGVCVLCVRLQRDPTNNALLISFLLSSDAENLLASTDWARKRNVVVRTTHNTQPTMHS